jgi:Kae1-associated kinase Bud32
MQEFDGGAEARIYSDGAVVIKDRLAKTYRIQDIDLSLRTFRTRREAKILSQLPIPGPKLIDATATIITMSFLQGKKLRDVLEQSPALAERAGMYLARLHSKDIVHGDLTTSNMIYDEQTDTLYFIDFGLSNFSKKIEDKAVDIHLFRQALESKHTTIWEEAFALFLRGYKSLPNWEPILERFAIVESRGRNKEKT